MVLILLGLLFVMEFLGEWHLWSTVTEYMYTESSRQGGTTDKVLIHEILRPFILWAYRISIQLFQ